MSGLRASADRSGRTAQRAALRWWPPVALLAMVLLGVSVGHGSTALDGWFLRVGDTHPALGRLLFFTDPRLLLGLLGLAVAAALYERRWRLAATMLATPVVALVAVRVLKRVFGRYKGDTLAYPGGHVTLTVVVLGMVVLVAGARVATVVAVAVLTALAMLGQAVTYHYFTDTVGAVLLATALVCVAVPAAGLDRCQPGCDLDHSSG